MEYEIPSDAEIVDAIMKVLRRKGVVESQAELRKEVMIHLHRINRNYKVSGKRIRVLALSTGKISLEIRYRLTDREVETMDKCPVCGSEVKRIENLTLDGGRVAIGFKCTAVPTGRGRSSGCL